MGAAASPVKQNPDNRPKRSLIRRIPDEAKRLAGIFLYLWVLFGLFAIHESLVLAKHGIEYRAYGLAFINAWLLAKVVLVAEDLRVARGFEDRPLVYPILYKSIVFTCVLMAFYIVEKALVGLWHGTAIAESVSLIGGGSMAGMLSVAAIVAVALMPFFAFREIGRAIGKRELHELLFTRHVGQRASPATREQ